MGGFSNLADDFELFLLEDGAVLYCESSHRLCALNNTAAAIWCLLKGEKQSEELERFLTNDLGLSAKKARDYLTTVLESTEALKRPAGKDVKGDTSPTRKRRKTQSSAIEPSVNWAAEHAVRTYTLLETRFSVRYPSAELEKLIHPTIAPLENTVSVADSIGIGFNAGDMTYAVSSDTGRSHSGLRINEIAPATRVLMLRTALGDTTNVIAIHSAAVSCRDSLLMFPGLAGCGKTTLTAALLKEGFRYVAEDTTVLSLRNFEAFPVPLSLTIKQGSWELLKHLYPELEGLPIHTRRDGHRVRYLQPPAASLAADHFRQQPLRWVVFPKRGPYSASLERIGEAELVVRLLSKSASKSKPLSKETVQRLVVWVKDVEAFDLRYSNLVEAIDLMVGLCQKD